jgi:hypothetical protein
MNRETKAAGKPGDQAKRPSRFRRILGHFLVLKDSPPPPVPVRREVEVEFPPRPARPLQPGSPRREAHLALDFGTSAISAALISGTGGVEVLEFQREGEGSAVLLLDSMYGRRVRLDSSDLVDNYEVASFLALGAGMEFYPCLKRRIELLARTEESEDWKAPAVLDVAALCCRTLQRVLPVGGVPLKQWLKPGFRIYLSVPNAFPSAATQVLQEGVAYGAAAALEATGCPEVEVILEAEAVAYRDLETRHERGEPVPARLLVLDAGAGTTDASIVQWENGVLRVVAHAGLPVGGIDLDAGIMVRHPAYAAGMRAQDFSQALRTAQELKEGHWGAEGEDDDETDGATTEGATRELAEALAGAGWGGEEQVPELTSYLGLVRKRYLTLAVQGVLECLPRADLREVTAVVVSGRASLLRGFRPEVERVLKDWEVAAASTAERDDDRKLAVIRGVGRYAAEPGSHLRLRPMRASFEMAVRHRTGRLPLIRTGDPLDSGWGVQAWYHPLDDHDTADDRVDVRLLPHDAIRTLAQQKELGWSINDLSVWSVLTTLRMEDDLPFRAAVAYDFMSRRAVGFCNGRVKEIVEGPDPGLGVGKFHPVHRQRENWFERSHQETT